MSAFACRCCNEFPCAIETAIKEQQVTHASAEETKLTEHQEPSDASAREPQVDEQQLREIAERNLDGVYTRRLLARGVLRLLAERDALELVLTAAEDLQPFGQLPRKMEDAIATARALIPKETP